MQNQRLRDAITNRNVQETERLLKLGADPNFALPESEYEGMADYKYQPYSPLRCVIFIISDATIGEAELVKDLEAATLLLNYGADAKLALELAEFRYGSLDGNLEITPFNNVLKLVKAAVETQNATD